MRYYHLVSGDRRREDDVTDKTLNPCFAMLLGGALLLSGCASGVNGLPRMPSPISSQYALDTGDEVRITAYGLEGFNNTYTVGDKGSISLPLLGDVPASGKTVGQLQDDIAAALIGKQIVNAPNVNVQINQYRPFYVVGEVKKPGEYPFRPGMTVLTALSVAGGYTFRAQTGKVAITRRLGTTNFTGSADEKAMIQPGDTIRVFEGWF
jgi:polysaccharide export outer membrane protein